MAIQRNRAEIVGWAGHDAELKKTSQKGISVVSLNVATHRFSKDSADGSSQPITEWHSCVFFGHLAERVATLKKGTHISVDGRIIPRSWEDKKGGHHRTVEIHAYSVQFDSKADEEKAPDSGDDAPAPEHTYIQEEI